MEKRLIPLITKEFLQFLYLFYFSHLAMDLFIGFFCLFIFVCFVVVLVISFLLRRISVLQWQLEATSGA